MGNVKGRYRLKIQKFRWKKNRLRRAFFLFLAPSFIGVLIFVLVPFLDVFKRSFTTAVTG